MKKGVFMNNSTTCTNNLPSPATLVHTTDCLSTDILAYCLGWLSWPLKNKNIHLEIGIHSDFFFNNLNLNIRPETRTL